MHTSKLAAAGSVLRHACTAGIDKEGKFRPLAAVAAVIRLLLLGDTHATLTTVTQSGQSQPVRCPTPEFSDNPATVWRRQHPGIPKLEALQSRVDPLS